jgi:two-component sensor histidine kinase
MTVEPKQEQPSLAERISQIQQIVPPILLAFTMFYEVTRHLIFPNVGHPALFFFEVLMFGITAPAVLWFTLGWVGHEIRAREAAEGEVDTRTRMMREMHHRIKNNLQTVADLLSLELARANGRLTDESLRDSVARIKSIAVAHELLSADQIGSAEVTSLARRIAESTHNALARPDQQIEVVVQGPPVFLNSKSATALALVINELVSNALEHGLVLRHTGRIGLELKQDEDWLVVRVQDDGVGLDKDFDLSRDAGLGLQIVRTLVEKDLHGALELESQNGTTADFRFRMNGVSL